MSSPLSTSAMRREYAAARCHTSQFLTTKFYGWSSAMYVERHTREAWRALSACLAKHRYTFHESAGGTYNCRRISGSSNYSLHSYGLAFDINPSRNGPQGTSHTDMPRSLIADIKAIHTGNGRHVFQWGGDWSPSSRDPMHFQIGATKADLSHGIVSPAHGGDAPPSSVHEEDNMLPLKKGDGMGSRAHKSADVGHVQYLFNHLYPDDAITVDGKFGSGTEAALRSKGLLAGNGKMQGHQYGLLLWRVGNK